VEYRYVSLQKIIVTCQDSIVTSQVREIVLLSSNNKQ